MFKTRTKNKALALLLVLAMVLAVMPVMASATYTPDVISNVNVGFGEPTMASTEPECYMSLSQVGTSTTYNAVYTNNSISGFYPDTFSLYAAPTSNFTGTLTLVADSTDTSVRFATYDQYGEATLHDTITYNTNENYNTLTNSLQKSYLFAVILTGAGDVDVTNGTTTLFTIHFSAPQAYIVSGATTTPSGFEGYLPVGQFATGSGWGSPFSNGAATLGSSGTPKIVGGYSSTGLSLGAAGGYAEYDMIINNYETVNGVSTKIQRPYGVDFVVYGNAFINNPEAGSVKVYGLEKNKSEYAWYELAGSLYYGDDITYTADDTTQHRNVTMRNVNVTYKKVESSNQYEGNINSLGIWYKIERETTVNGTTTTTTLLNWTKFNTNTSVAWWPEASEGYLGTNGVYGAVDDVVVNDNQTEITFKHITLIRDTDTTPDYAFGYFDVTPNGSSYGTAVNPYVYGTTGGNGYDLDWAVDSDGKPVELTTISKIRVYSSAVMKATGGETIFTTPSIFGETSAELCGIYATSGTATNSPTSAPTILINNTPIATWIGQQKVTATNVGDVIIYNATAMGLTSSTATISVTAASGTTANIYINNNAGGSYNKPSTVDMVRVIAQTGDGAPYIAVIKF